MVRRTGSSPTVPDSATLSWRGENSLDNPPLPHQTTREAYESLPRRIRDASRTHSSHPQPHPPGESECASVVTPVPGPFTGAKAHRISPEASNHPRPPGPNRHVASSSSRGGRGCWYAEGGMSGQRALGRQERAAHNARGWWSLSAGCRLGG